MDSSGLGKAPFQFQAKDSFPSSPVVPLGNNLGQIPSSAPPHPPSKGAVGSAGASGSASVARNSTGGSSSSSAGVSVELVSAGEIRFE